MSKVFHVATSFSGPAVMQGNIIHRIVEARYTEKRDVVGLLVHPDDLAAYNRWGFGQAGTRIFLGGSYEPGLDLKGQDCHITSCESVKPGTGIFLEVPSHFEEQVQEFKARRPLAAPPSPEGEPRSRAWAWSLCSCPSSGCCVHIQPEGKSWADIWPGVWKNIMKKLGLK